MELEKLTIGEIRQLQGLFNVSACSKSHPYKIGEKYFIRTVTHHYTGKLIEVCKDELVLEDCAWIADDGRFSENLEKALEGKAEAFAEIEPYPDGKVIIGRGAVLDAFIIGITPREQK